MEDIRYKLGFIGTGNMGTALIKGILESGLYKSDQIIVFDKEKTALDNTYKKFGVIPVSSNIELVTKTFTVIICVKPQNIREVLYEIRDDITSSHLIISIAAGISIDMILRTLGKDIPIIRVMPNTPAIIQKGMSGIAYGPGIKKEHKDIALNIFNSVGEIIVVEEPMIDLITAISGSGPGYVFRIMECMVDVAISFGMDNESAKRLVVQTFLGASHLANESNESLSRLRQMVTSPKGTTEAGLSVFEKTGIKSIIHNAIKAAYERAIEMKKEWEK